MMRFAIVDAFTNEIFGGNPAGIVILPKGKDFPAEEVMIKTAAELRHSETVFIKKMPENRFRLRYFTPAAEVELCGHATIGAFSFLKEEGMVDAANGYINETLAGDLNVSVEDDFVLMDMSHPEIVGGMGEEDRKELYRVMGLSEKDQGEWEEYPALTLEPKKVSTGLPDIMMPVADERELEKIDPDHPALAELSKKHQVVGVHAFTLNSKDGKIHARNFAPLYQINEEAATGTANGALIYYLYTLGLAWEGKPYTIVQGEKMGRPSLIMAKLQREGEKERIMVGGTAATLVKGEILLEE